MAKDMLEIPDPEDLLSEDDKDLLITVLVDIRHIRIDQREMKQDMKVLNGQVREADTALALVQQAQEKCPMMNPETCARLLNLVAQDKGHRQSRDEPIVAGLTKRDVVSALVAVILALVLVIGWLTDIKILDLLR